MFAGQASAGVEQLALLVAQGAAVTLGTLAAVRLGVQRDALSMDAPERDNRQINQLTHDCCIH